MKYNRKHIAALLALPALAAFVFAALPTFAYDDWKLLKFLEPKACDWRQTRISRQIIERFVDDDDDGFGKPLDSEIGTDGENVREIPFPNHKRLSIAFDNNQMTDLFMKDDLHPASVRHVRFIGYGNGGIDEIQRDGKPTIRFDRDHPVDAYVGNTRIMNSNRKLGKILFNYLAGDDDGSDRTKY